MANKNYDSGAVNKCCPKLVDEDYIEDEEPSQIR